MEFSNRLYELRKKRGLSQEEAANKLNVTRQTFSKWENGDSTPDIEKLVAISDLFGISMDELVLGKEQKLTEGAGKTAEILCACGEKVWTPENKKTAKKGLKILGILAGIVLAIDIISMIVYFLVYGVPK